MADVFVSYKREERDKVEALVAVLKSLGLDVWFDAELTAGDRFASVISQQLKSAKAIVVCWSKAAVESEWVQAEADRARSLSTYASVVLEECELPVPFNVLHAASLETWSAGVVRHEGLRQLVEKLATLVGPHLRQRFAELGNIEKRRADETIVDASAEDGEEGDGEEEAIVAQAPTGGSISRVLASCAGVQSAGASEFSAVLAQSMFEEEVLANDRTRWIVAPDVAVVANLPAHATLLTSLSDAIQRATAGDCIAVFPGTYSGDLDIDKDIRVVGFGSKEKRPILIDTSQGIELRGRPRLENLIIESRERGNAVRCAVRSAPTLVGCLVSRLLLVKDPNPAILVQSGSDPLFVSCTVSGSFCPAFQFNGDARGRIVASDIYSREIDAVVVQGTARPQFDRCKVFASDGHAVVSRGNAGARFENCSLKASGHSTLKNIDQSYSRFVGNRVSVRRGALIEVGEQARGRFERNRLEPDPENKVLEEINRAERKKLFGRKFRPIPPTILVHGTVYNATFALNRLPDGREARPDNEATAEDLKKMMRELEPPTRH